MAIFSLPINPKLSEEFVTETFIPFLKTHKDLIFDLYFTCRMPPFLQDAMGDTFAEDIRFTTYNALYISEQTGIPLSATFNNPHVIPNQENLDVWIGNFAGLYERGVRIVTLPHTTWMLTGQIQKAFPDLYVKNTILREVSKANDIVSLAKAGFNYINLDRDLMRDKDQLLRLKQAKEYCASIGLPVRFSMLVNEGCWGGCPIMPEHYHYNTARRPDNPQYFNDTISRVSCSLWDERDPASSLKAANLPPWKKDWEEMFDLGIDVFKMHGRENAMRLKESMDIIERWSNDDELLFPQFNSYIEDTSITEKPIDIWREKIKSCKFDCWDCNYCDSVVQSRLRKEDRTLDEYVNRILLAIDSASKHESSFNQDRFFIPGLTSNKVRHLLNNLCSYSDSIYLELGCYTGSTFYAALDNNPIRAFAVDNFKDPDIKPFRDDIFLPTIKDPAIEFLSKFQNPRWSFANKDVAELTDKDICDKPNIIFYDAGHEYWDQHKNLKSILPLLQDKFILVLDDANFDGVVDSANDLIEEENLKVLFQRKILTTIPEDENSWWNGLYILVLKK
jgi:hypothetical protein